MVKTLLQIAKGFRVPVLELTGAGLLVVGAYRLAEWAAFVVAGVALLGKSLEIDLREQRDAKQ